jgi:hypothetical protein
MNPLAYVKIIVAVALVAGAFAFGWSMNGDRWSAKYADLQKQDAEASQKAQAAAEAKAQADTAAYNAQLADTESKYEIQLKASRAAADTIAASLRNYQNHRSANGVPQGAGSTSGADGAPGNAGSVAGIEESTQRVLEACSDDATRLAALQAERASLAALNK